MDKDSSSEQGDPNANIWITARARMQSHARYSFYDLLSHIVLTAYSVLLLAFSVFSDHLSGTPLGSYATEISIVLSLSILCASLVTWGLKFQWTAGQHRDCYLALQRLYDDEKKEKSDDYNSILDRYPNHSDFDYSTMIFRKVRLQKKQIKDRNGLVKCDNYQAAVLIFFSLFRILVGSIIITAPILFLVFVYVAT